MTARDSILAAIRSAGVPPAPAAPLAARLAAADTDPERIGLHAAFLRVLSDVGGLGVIRGVNQSVAEAATALLPDARDDATIVRGRFAVAENAAVYVDAEDLTARNAIVLAEHLVLVVPFAAIVPTMHEAMPLMPARSGCGWFLSGPSKTADIEQSLVFGAQGARTLRVIFDPES